MTRLAVLLLCLGAAACGRGEGVTPADDPAIAEDPVIARALHDPLMSDPDLASRNEANAAVGFPDSHALPVLRGSSEAAQAAREALRLELLAGGPIPELPDPREGEGGPALGPMAGPATLLAAAGAPEACAGALKEDFALAASLPGPAAIPPGAMVLQAGGSEARGCRVRIIRYRSPAPVEDLLQYHLTRASRAGLAARRFAAPEDIVLARSKAGEALAVHVRPAPHGLSGVTLVYRAP
ncbi:hypothetical protein ACLBKU_00200 [Erythrobacter sp. NE805]|uniref:hypothetical protein n=1 Tax=Erythrobacter sp. NE805 TaxID=3389875 RepID=UPI00396AFA40